MQKCERWTKQQKSYGHFHTITTFSHTSSSRPEDETHEQHTRSTIQARIARTRAEAPQDVSSMFLRARMVDVHGEDKERMLMTKTAKGHFTSHIVRPRCKALPERETRRATWETQMSFNAVFCSDRRKKLLDLQVQVARLIPCNG